MDNRKDKTIKETTVREVVAVFHSRAELDESVNALMMHGFDRADIDLLGSREKILTRFGGMQPPAEYLADIPAVPRRALLGHQDIDVTMVLVTTLAGCVGAFAALMYAMDAGGDWLLTMLAALVGGLAAGGATAAIGASTFRRWRNSEGASKDYGLIVWVRVRSPEQEEQAQTMLRELGGRAISVHQA